MPDRLTPREVECVQLAGQRLSNDQIGALLTISTRTVANNLQSAFRKLGVNDRLSAARALVIRYPEHRMTMAPVAAPSPDRGAAVEDLAGPIGGWKALTDGVYRRYVALGRWRLPPRWGGRRIGLVFLAALTLSIFVGVVSMSLRSLVELIDILQRRPI